MAKDKSKAKNKDAKKKDKNKKKVSSKKKDVKNKKTKKDKPKSKAPKRPKHKKKISAEERIEMIRTAAYYLAEKRGHLGNCEMDDWIEAEKEINTTTD